MTESVLRCDLAENYGDEACEYNTRYEWLEHK
uniref:Uncharacterized protein n=1 Tax=Anguilla anguilla TaxID=7936 RepID=A0A0E9VIB5_ANGAN